MRKRKALLNLFLQNTGRTTIRPPRMPSVNEVVGYQIPRCDKVPVAGEVMTTDKQIVLSFVDKETAQYVRLICTRKGITLEDYILDNFEWDHQPACFSDLNEGEKITILVCEGCEYIDKCPDAVKA